MISAAGQMINLTSNLALFGLVRPICIDFNGFNLHGMTFLKVKKTKESNFKISPRAIRWYNTQDTTFAQNQT